MGYKKSSDSLEEKKEQDRETYATLTNGRETEQDSLCYSILTLQLCQAPLCGRVLVVGERDTYRGNTIENRGCLFMFGRTL